MPCSQTSDSLDRALSSLTRHDPGGDAHQHHPESSLHHQHHPSAPHAWHARGRPQLQSRAHTILPTMSTSMLPSPPHSLTAIRPSASSAHLLVCSPAARKPDGHSCDTRASRKQAQKTGTRPLYSYADGKAAVYQALLVLRRLVLSLSVSARRDMARLHQEALRCL